MNEADVIAALRVHWLAVGPRIRVVLEPEEYADLLWEDDDREMPRFYHRTSIRSASSVAVTIGGTREENRGQIMVQVFAPRENGPGGAERLASAVAQAWRTFRHERIRLSAPSVAGLSPQGAFNRQLVTIGWRADMRPTRV